MRFDVENELDSLADKGKKEAAALLLAQTFTDIDGLKGREEVVRLTLLSIMQVTREKLLAMFKVAGRPSDDFFRVELIISRAILDKSSRLGIN